MVLMEVAKPFGYVLGVTAASFLVHHMWMPAKVMAARKKFGVQFPNLYATSENCKDEKSMNDFNCVQRGHQNSLESHPIFLALLLASGVKHPITSAVLGAIYLLGRIVYFASYSSGKPEARTRGSFMYIGLLGLLITTVKFAVNLLAE